MSRRLLLLITLLLPACYPTLPTYRIEMTRAQVAEQLGRRKPLNRASRDARGLWPIEWQVDLVAARLPEARMDRAESCEIYWVPRGLFGLGLYEDYLFFDRADRLAAWYRRFVD